VLFDNITLESAADSSSRIVFKERVFGVILGI